MMRKMEYDMNVLYYSSKIIIISFAKCIYFVAEDGHEGVIQDVGCSCKHLWRLLSVGANSRYYHFGGVQK